VRFDVDTCDLCVLIHLLQSNDDMDCFGTGSLPSQAREMTQALLVTAVRGAVRRMAGEAKVEKPPTGMSGQFGWEERAPTEDSVGTTEILVGL